jgi:uncharacterized protein with von Willebrand factor type A (vWA) domain
MFFSFVDELRAAGIQASLKEHLTLLEALDASVIETRPEDFYYLARATFVKDESLLDRFDQVFGKGLQGHCHRIWHRSRSHPRGVAAEGRGALSDARADGGDQGARLLGRDHGDPEAAPCRAAGPAPGRKQVDRHGRHLALRAWRL